MRPGRSLALDIFDQTEEHADAQIVFEDVLTYKCTYLPALDVGFSEFYDKLIVTSPSRLGVKSSEHSCYCICFDDGPFYEIVARGFSAR